MEKKIWNHRELMEEACERADKELRDMFPNTEVTLEDGDGTLYYKEYYQDIFNGLYDDIEAKLPEVLSKEENNWIEYEDGEEDIHYRIVDKNSYLISNGVSLYRIDVDRLTLEEVETCLKYNNIELYYEKNYLCPFEIAIYKFIYLLSLEDDSRV